MLHWVLFFWRFCMSLYVDNKYVRLVSSRLRNFKQKKEDLYNFSCPICGDSQKNKLKARGYIFRKGNDLFYTCHNCRVGLSLGNFINHVDSSLHKEYVMERYTSGETGKGKTKRSEPKFNIPIPKFGKVESNKTYEHSEWCSNLLEGNICRTYLETRNIPKKFWNKLLYTEHFKQFVDTLVPNHGKEITDDARLVIPFYDEHGELIAVSGRALEDGAYKLRYVTVRTIASDEKLIYGMERIDKNKIVKVVEGPIDSIFLDNCVASGDSNLSITAQILIDLGIPKENLVLILDQEPRNKEIVKMVGNAIKNDYKVVIWPDNIVEKDINEMVMSKVSVEDIEKTIKENTYQGLHALTKFTFWKKV